MGKHKGRPPAQLSVLQGEDLALRGRLAEEARKIRDEVVSLTPPFPEGIPCHLIRLQTRGSVPHFATPEALRAVVKELNRLSERYFQLGPFVITPTELGLCLALGENPGSGRPYTLRFVLGKLKAAVARAALGVSEGLEAEFGISPEVLRRDPQRFWHGEAVVRDLRERADWEQAAVELAVLPAIRNYCPEPLAYPASWFNLDPERYGELMAGQFPLSSDYLSRQAEIAEKVREIDQSRYREAVSGLPRDFVPSRPFRVVADFEPTGDQPEAIEKLVEGYQRGAREQVLLGVTGVGKTFILAKVIEKLQLPTLVLAHNKTLAAQLCSELRAFFPDNAVEYFVSYYDYYQPEAYIPQTNTYIEKEADINEEIDRLRHAATEALLTRRDVIVVASVSCIYGLGSPEDYEALSLHLVPGMVIGRERLIRRLVDMQYRRNQLELERGCFRVRGDTVEVFPADKEEIYRLELFDDELEAILVIDPLTFRVREELDHLFLYPSTHYVLIPEKKELALKSIEWELEDFLPKLLAAGKLLEAQRLRERVNYDLEMLRELGYCNGIENYSRHFSGKLPGEPPSNLLDYFPEEFFLVIDESHVTIPQVRGMYNGDRSRKETLVEYGFRLPSALDNRPLRFDEFQRYMKRVLYMSATPGDWELARAEQVAEAVIRPTGLVDPKIEVHPTENQIDHLIGELREVVKRKQRALVTTLTKKMAEKLSDHLQEYGFKVNYLHSDIDTVERIRILRDLRAGVHDVVVGVNLLREGLDLPEVALVAILDADKEGFLRSDKSLVQIIGRAARNLEGKVLLYADRLTPAMERAITETNRRREKQLDYNRHHGITPRSIRKPVRAITDELEQAGLAKVVSKRGKGKGRKGVGRVPSDPEEVRLALITPKATGFDPAEGMAKLDLGELQLLIVELEQRMELLAQELEYEKAALLRDRLYAAEKELDRRLRQKKPAWKHG